MTEQVTEQMLVDLRWMLKVNDTHNCGLYGPSVVRHGPVSTCEELCKRGLATTRGRKAGGYWITDAGRAALASAEGKK